MAHRVDQEGVVAVDSVVEKLIFKPQDVVSIRAKDSDLEYATHDVFVDSAITGKLNGGLGFQKWGRADGGADELALILELVPYFFMLARR